MTRYRGECPICPGVPLVERRVDGWLLWYCNRCRRLRRPRQTGSPQPPRVWRRDEHNIPKE